MDVTLLGPQRITTAARSSVRELVPEGTVAAINSGWQEREADDAELGDVLGGRMRNLELFRRWREIHDADEEYSLAERRLDDLLEELQTFYAVRLQHAMAAIDAVRRRREVPVVQAEALADAIRAVQALDEWHLGAVTRTRAEFVAAIRPGERDAIARHRREVASIVGDSAGLVITGGHVGVLLRTLRIFAIHKIIKVPVIAWSAGAMALGERVVLFHDMATQGAGHAEVYAAGLAAYRGVIPFPHARRRLRINDEQHIGLIARRFAPSACLVLADGERVDLRDEAPLPAGARTFSPDGGLATEGAA